jgi:hypothetical protein
MEGSGTHGRCNQAVGHTVDGIRQWDTWPMESGSGTHSRWNQAVGHMADGIRQWDTRSMESGSGTHGRWNKLGAVPSAEHPPAKEQILLQFKGERSDCNP